VLKQHPRRPRPRTLIPRIAHAPKLRFDLRIRAAAIEDQIQVHGQTRRVVRIARLFGRLAGQHADVADVQLDMLEAIEELERRGHVGAGADARVGAEGDEGPEGREHECLAWFLHDGDAVLQLWREVREDGARSGAAEAGIFFAEEEEVAVAWGKVNHTFVPVRSVVV
tara:strand:- start:3212 stop:3715 length:504 start_codon:yes stop_codon:yes gene_type:complete